MSGSQGGGKEKAGSSLETPTPLSMAALSGAREAQGTALGRAAGAKARGQVLTGVIHRTSQPRGEVEGELDKLLVLCPEW